MVQITNRHRLGSVIALPTICALTVVAAISLSQDSSKAQSSQFNIDLEKLRNASLAKHNEYRQTHGIQPLELDETLNRSAQQWAEQLAQRTQQQTTGEAYFEHSENRVDVGENLASYSTSSELPNAQFLDATRLGNESTTDWYIEIDDYDFNNPGKQKRGSEGKMIGHFTQVVWKDTTKLGCGAAATNANLDFQGSTRRGTAVFVVCQYSPNGNVTENGGENEYRLYQENVLPPK